MMSARHPRVVSIDVPSGWDVDALDASQVTSQGSFINPLVLVSLSAPKLVAKVWESLPVTNVERNGHDDAKCTKKRHYLGGRFIPPYLAAELNLKLPAYPGADVIVDITEPPQDLYES